MNNWVDGYLKSLQGIGGKAEELTIDKLKTQNSKLKTYN
jgi:hypothetical protein